MNIPFPVFNASEAAKVAHEDKAQREQFRAALRTIVKRRK